MEQASKEVDIKKIEIAEIEKSIRTGSLLSFKAAVDSLLNHKIQPFIENLR